MYTAIYLLRDVIWPVYKLRKVFTVCLGLRSLRRREIISCKIIFTINVDILLAITQNRRIAKAAYLIFIKNKSVSTHV